MEVEEQVDKLLQNKNPVKKHFNRKWYIGIGAFVVTVLIITLTALPLFDDKSLLSHAQTYLESKTNNNPLVASQPLNGSAYDYWYAPENSFGIQQTKNVNFTFWRSWLKKYFSYELEARQNNESAWQNANSLLNVSLLFNETNNTCKVTLTLNTSNAPMSLYYRFTLVANRSVISHVNKSVNYQYTLNLSANATENYSLVYNYSDLVPYIQSGVINIKQGIYNNYFYQRIKTNKKIVVNKTFVIDPNFGFSGVGAYEKNLGDYIRGTNATCPTSGTADNISARMTGWQDGEAVKLAIYKKSDDTLIGVTNERSDGGSGWQVFTFSDPKPSVVGSTEYILCGWGDSSCAIYSDSDSWYRYVKSSAYGSYPNPFDGTSGASAQYKMHMLCYYTESDGLTWQTVNSSINGSAYNETAWQVVNSSINGSAYNETAWQVVNSSINGTAYNETAWQTVNNSINGSAYNETVWTAINTSINGSAYNETAWQVVNSSINGSAFNVTAMTVINNTINGSAFNATAWQTINNTINGSAYNVSMYWKTVNNTINGSCYNTSIPAPFNILLEFPVNESSSTSYIQPTVYFNLSHPDGYTMNYSLYIHNTTLVYTGVNVSNGTQVHTSHLFYSANTTYTDYYWRVVANDGMGNWVNETYNFQAILQGGGKGGVNPLSVALSIGILGGMAGGVLIIFVFLPMRRKKKESEEEVVYYYEEY